MFYFLAPGIKVQEMHYYDHDAVVHDTGHNTKMLENYLQTPWTCLLMTPLS